MSQEKAFLVEIAERPDDPAARLIYADWLDEHGDPRGEFIRIQEELNGLPAYADRYWALKPRRNKLRARIDPVWLDRLDYAPAYRPLFTTIPVRRPERWRLVEEFIEHWHGPLKSGDGAPEEELRRTERRLGIRLPAALREWHALAGRRKDVWSRQDELLQPADMKISEQDDALIIRYENQCVVQWGIRKDDLERDDPPVYCFDLPCESANHLASPTVSEFAMLVAVHDATCDRAITTADYVGEESWAFAEIRELFQRCALPDRYWVLDPVYHYEGRDLVAIESVADEWLYVAARTERAYAQLSPRLRSILTRY